MIFTRYTFSPNSSTYSTLNRNILQNKKIFCKICTYVLLTSCFLLGYHKSLYRKQLLIFYRDILTREVGSWLFLKSKTIQLFYLLIVKISVQNIFFFSNQMEKYHLSFHRIWKKMFMLKMFRLITCFSYILMISLDCQNKMANYFSKSAILF